MQKETKIAAVVITYNDDYKFKEWCRWYEEYKDQLALYVVVDNNSKQEYKEQVKNYFKDAHIIWRKTNGGCTNAYNDGIRYALSQPEVTHIALLGNDLRLEKNCLPKCAQLLNSDEKLGMVSPIVLDADSDIVHDFGDGISEMLTMKPFGIGERIDNISEEIRYCEALTGGMNISKRSFYETTVGLQDEKLFMYSDEVDMALRAKAAGITMAVTKKAKAWHQHINPPGNKRRHPFSNYLIARNKIYLGKKHFGLGKQIAIFNHFFFSGLLSYSKNLLLMRWNQLIYPRWTMIGALNGLLGNMKENKYSKLNFK